MHIECLYSVAAYNTGVELIVTTAYVYQVKLFKAPSPVHTHTMSACAQPPTMQGRQEDAQEFLGLVLDSLHEEMVAALSTVTHGRWLTPFPLPHLPPHALCSLGVSPPLTGPVSNPDKSSSLEDHPDDSLEEGEELGEGEEWEQVGWNNKSMVTRQVRGGRRWIERGWGRLEGRVS